MFAMRRHLRSTRFLQRKKVVTSAHQVISVQEARPLTLSRSVQLASIGPPQRVRALKIAFNAQKAVPRTEKVNAFAFFVAAVPRRVKIVQLAAALVPSAHGRSRLTLASARQATTLQSSRRNSRRRHKIWTVVPSLSPLVLRISLSTMKTSASCNPRACQKRTVRERVASMMKLLKTASAIMSRLTQNSTVTHSASINPLRSSTPRTTRLN